ncbi:Amino acid transporter transmembrane domain-containing protein [Entamoeba marina]
MKQFLNLRQLHNFFFDLGGFGTLFSAFSVSLACHHNLPDVVTATRSKKHLRFIVIAGITTATFFYVVIGFSNSLCFGDDTKTPVTHNWLNYTGCNGGFGTCDTGSDRWYAIIIQWLVLLFPPINLSSEYPLFCLTLSSNIRQLIPKQIREKRPKFWLYFCRLSASLPPLIAGAIKGDLDVIFNFAGIFGFFLLFIIPSTFQIYSTFIIQRKFGKNSHISEFSGIYSSPYIAWPVLILSIACFSFSFVQFVDESFGFGWY